MQFELGDENIVKIYKRIHLSDVKIYKRIQLSDCVCIFTQKQEK